MTEQFLAMSENDDALAVVQPFAGDEPDVATLPGTLTAGQNLVAGTVLGRVAATGAYSQYAPAASDGTQHAIAVLCHDINAVSATKCEVYVAGCFNIDWLTWPTVTAAQKLGAFDGSQITARSLNWSM